jgi:asparagine synthase (glutamine-hydrolysing)
VSQDDGLSAEYFRLSLDTGAQPLISQDGKLILAVNGEIYNHIKLKNELGPNIHFKTHSDCEVIIPLVGNQHCTLLANHS